MLFTKTTPVGVDVPIQKLQTFLYDELKALWKLDDTSLEGNGRCYREKADGGYVPMLFVPGTNDVAYRKVEFIDDTQAALFFFDVWDSVSVSSGTPSVKLDLIFLVNISKIKNTLLHRGDEEVRIDVQQLCLSRNYNFTLTEFGTGYKYVFGRFDGLTSKGEEQLRDVHPLHVFKLGFELIYNIFD